MYEIFFQPKDGFKIKGNLAGIYIQDEKQFLKDFSPQDIEKMVKIKADGLFIRPDPKRFNYKCYIDYHTDFDDTFIYIIIKEED